MAVSGPGWLIEPYPDGASVGDDNGAAKHVFANITDATGDVAVDLCGFPRGKGVAIVAHLDLGGSVEHVENLSPVVRVWCVGTLTGFHF